MIEMPPKASRVFTVDPVSGEVRCGDPSCNVTQCWQCNTEQNKRKKEKRRQEAEQAKAAQAEREREQAIQDQQAGKRHQWTFDNEDVTDASMVMQQLQNAQAVQEQLEKVQQEEEKMVADADERGRQAQAEADERERQAQAKPAAGNKGAGKKGASDGRTKWNHTTRTLLFKAIMKFNPFAAAVKKDAWAKISEEMAAATAGMNDLDKGDFRVKTDGHGLEVFYDRQIENMGKKTANEETTSGQTGADVTAEEREEFGLLEGCRAKEKDAALIKQRKRDAKQALEDLRNNEVNDAVREAAISDKPVQIKLYKVLQTRVRAAKLEASTWSKSNPSLGQFAYSMTQLRDIEELQKLKDAHGHLTGTGDNTDTDFPADNKGSDDPETTRMKGGKVAVAIAAIAAKLPDATMFAPPDFNQFATSFFAAKRAAESAMPQAPKRTLKERLDEVKETLAAGTITQKEADDFSTRIKKAFFMRDD